MHDAASATGAVEAATVGLPSVYAAARPVSATPPPGERARRDPDAEPSREAPPGFDHTPFDELLDEFVDGGGGIDFARWRADPSAVARLDGYLGDIARCSPDNAPEQFREPGSTLAYWTRAYNGFLVRAVLSHARQEHLRHPHGPIAALHYDGVLRALEFKAGGRRWDVSRLERERLRGDVEDARALLIWSRSDRACPVLAPDLPELGPALDAFLALVARGFLGGPAGVRVDHHARRIRVAPLLVERADDFVREVQRRGGAHDRGLIDFLCFAGPPALRAELERAADYELVSFDGVPVTPTVSPRTPAPGAAEFEVEVLAGESARRFLHAPETVAAWTRLYAACPWATASQSQAFVVAWFQAYAQSYEPVFVTAAAPNGDLVGLLPLAIESATGTLAAAGTHHAEYQTWLAEPWVGEEFGQRALERLRRLLPRTRLSFLYLAPGTPTTWVETDPTWARRCVAEPMLRALVDLREAAAEGSLKKSGNRSRLNRLKREGALRFERIIDPDELAKALDEIVPMYDLRQGAENGVLPFATDPRKREFHEALFAAGLLHVTVLRVGERIAAAHLGVIQGDRVCLGVFAHSPFLAKHSPGKLLLHMLFEKLLEEGFATFDMTPGHGWKERFATRTDVVVTLRVHFSTLDASVRRARLAAERTAKAAALRLGTTPDAVRGLAGRLRRLGLRGSVRTVARRVARVRHWFREDVEYCIYTMTREQAAAAQPQARFATNRIEDLLLFQPTEDWQTRQGFLSESLERLAEGHHVYTYVADGVLVSYGWLAFDQERSLNTEVGQELVLPPGSAVAYDYHTHPLGRGKGLHKSALATALNDAASVAGTTRVWTGVLATNGPSRHNCIKMGWTHELSQWKHVRFGRPQPAADGREWDAARGGADD